MDPSTLADGDQNGTLICGSSQLDFGPFEATQHLNTGPPTKPSGSRLRTLVDSETQRPELSSFVGSDCDTPCRTDRGPYNKSCWFWLAEVYNQGRNSYQCHVGILRLAYITVSKMGEILIGTRYYNLNHDRVSHIVAILGQSPHDILWLH